MGWGCSLHYTGTSVPLSQLAPKMKTFFGTKILHLKFLHWQSVCIFGFMNAQLLFIFTRVRNISRVPVIFILHHLFSANFQLVLLLGLLYLNLSVLLLWNSEDILSRSLEENLFNSLEICRKMIWKFHVYDRFFQELGQPSWFHLTMLAFGISALRILTHGIWVKNCT